MDDRSKIHREGLHREGLQFLKAVRSGNLPGIEQFLIDGVDKEYKGTQGTAICEAAIHGNLAVLQLLVQAGVNLEAKNNRSNTALMEAAARGHLKFVMRLFEVGASLQDNATTALHRAAVGGQVAVGACLLKAGIHVDQQDHKGFTPLMEAAVFGQLAFVEFLLEAGADVTKEDMHGYTAFSLAAYGTGPKDMPQNLPQTALRLLQAKVAHDLKSNSTVPPHVGLLHIHMKRAVLVCLVESGVAPKMHFQDGTTLLHFSAAHDDTTRETEILIQAGADVNARNEDGQTALMIAAGAAKQCALRNVYRLVEAGADVNIQDNNGSTALMIAITENNHGFIHVILARKPNLNLADNDSKTALLHALDLPRQDDVRYCVCTLLEAGADTEAQDADCKTALIKALELDQLGLHLEMMDRLLKAGAQLERQDDTGSTALLVAVRLRLPRAVDKLIKLGADLETANLFGRTPLITAVMKGDLPIVEMLLQAGADKEHYDADYRSPLFVAAELNRRPIVEKLLTVGARVVDKRDKLGRNAVDVTRVPEIKELLQRYAAQEMQRMGRLQEFDDLSTTISASQYPDDHSTAVSSVYGHSMDKEAHLAAQEGTDDQSLAISGMSSNIIGLRGGQSLGLSLGLQSVGCGSIASDVSAGFGNDFDGLILEDTASTADTVEDEQRSKHQRIV